MPIRNPFARRPGITVTNDENNAAETNGTDVAHPGFERVDTVGSRASLSLSIPSRKSQDTGEYKMSVVNDSGVYLPPSPTEKDSSWPRRYLSRTSTDTRSSTGEIEHFSISRESFDSYRRSFDICAKSPVIVVDKPRGSLDSAKFTRLPRSALSERRFEREPPTPEEGFEDVGLNDESARQDHLVMQPPQQQPKKRSFFKFGSEHQDTANANTAAQPTTMSRFLPGRKRDHNGVQDAELGAMPSAGIDRPGTANSLVEQEA